MEQKRWKRWLRSMAAMLIVSALTCVLLAGSVTAQEGEDAQPEEAVQENMETEAAEADYDYMILVNKTHKLPDDWEDKVVLAEGKNIYGETYLVEEKALESFEALREELLEEGIDIELDSVTRSVAEQQELWDEWTIEYGEDYVKKYVAVPGYSEHHTGLAIDICIDKDGVRINDNDEMIAEREIFGKIHERLADYGFILRYLEGADAITGYSYEPWHFRYINDPAVAKEIMDAGITFEEYLGEVPSEDAASEDVVIDYGTSEIYSQDDMDAAIALIREEFGKWDEGCELHSIRYASDECVTEENLRWMNDLGEDQNYTQVIEFLSDYHSPVDAVGAWEPDTEYTDWQWWLARTEGGEWELMTSGY